jgi:hypothetical protein
VCCSAVDGPFDVNIFVFEQLPGESFLNYDGDAVSDTCYAADSGDPAHICRVDHDVLLNSTLYIMLSSTAVAKAGSILFSIMPLSVKTHCPGLDAVHGATSVSVFQDAAYDEAFFSCLYVMSPSTGTRAEAAAACTSAHPRAELPLLRSRSRGSLSNPNANVMSLIARTALQNPSDVAWMGATRDCSDPGDCSGFSEGFVQYGPVPDDFSVNLVSLKCSASDDDDDDDGPGDFGCQPWLSDQPST